MYCRGSSILSIVAQVRGGAPSPQLAWALAPTQLLLSLQETQPLVELFAFPADFTKDLGSQVNVIPSWVIVSLGFLDPQEGSNII